MDAYVNGLGIISPNGTPSHSDHWKLDYIIKDRYTCVEPDYQQWLDGKALRRMSRILKMGSASALLALKEARVDIPDCIITGTAYGCLQDTGIFLRKMIENDEVGLNPTPFIQSTHNSIGSQVAMLLKCHGYNQTFTQRSFSFEHALLDSLLILQENPAFRVLTGSVDELTDDSFALLSRLGMFRQGYGAGEGSVFSLLATTCGASSYCKMKGVRTIYGPAKSVDIKMEVEKFLNNFSLSLDQIDFVLNGQARNDKSTLNFIEEDRIIYFKDYCGEYPTASSFAFGLGSYALRYQRWPEGLKSKPNNPDSIEHILIYSSYFDTHYGMILLERV